MSIGIADMIIKSKVSATFLRILSLLVLSGCITQKPSDSPKVSAPKSEGARAKQVMIVLSEPIGLTVFVNGVPLGKTPYELEVEKTSSGFFTKEVSIRVRFLAAHPGQLSRTIEEVFSTLDKIPSSLMFSTEGVGRATP